MEGLGNIGIRVLNTLAVITSLKDNGGRVELPLRICIYIERYLLRFDSGNVGHHSVPCRSADPMHAVPDLMAQLDGLSMNWIDFEHRAAT